MHLSPLPMMAALGWLFHALFSVIPGVHAAAAPAPAVAPIHSHQSVSRTVSAKLIAHDLSWPGDDPAAPAPAAAPAPPPPDLPRIIAAAFAPLGSGAVAWAERIAVCESSLDPRAVNPDSGTKGLFQFKDGTWAGTPEAGRDPFDPATNARAAAWLYQTYGPGQWECK